MHLGVVRGVLNSLDREEFVLANGDIEVDWYEPDSDEACAFGNFYYSVDRAMVSVPGSKMVGPDCFCLLECGELTHSDSEVDAAVAS